MHEPRPLRTQARPPSRKGVWRQRKAAADRSLVREGLNRPSLGRPQQRVIDRRPQEQELTPAEDWRPRDPLAARTTAADGDNAVRLREARVRPTIVWAVTGARHDPAADGLGALDRGDMSASETTSPELA